MTEELKAGMLVEVDLKDLIIDARDRTKEDLKKIEELASSMKALGLITPIVIQPSDKEEGKAVVIAGKRRVVAAKKLKWQKIRAYVVEYKEPGDTELALISDNLLHRQVEAVLHGRIFKQLLDDKIFTSQTALAKNAGLSQSTVSRWIALTDKDEAVQEALQEGELPLTGILKSKKKSKDDIKKDISATKFYRVGPEFIHPLEGDGKPNFTLSIGMEDVKINFVLSLKDVENLGFSEALTRELNRVGEDDVKLACKKLHKQYFG